MTQPISFWALEVPAGESPTPMISDIPRHSTTVRITMAAIDPTAAPIDKDEPLRATLKIMRRALDVDDYPMSDDDDESEDEEDDDDDDESEDEAPKDKKGNKLSKKETEAAVKKALKIAQENAEKMEVDGDDSEEEDDDEMEDGDFEVEEFVICTLDPKNHYQQPLDLTIDEEDEVFFKVIGNFDVSLSGNYTAPAHNHENEEGEYDSEEDSDYDLSPDEDELYGEVSDDELDDIPNPRITEVDSEEEEEEEEEKPKKETKAEKKSLKRAAEELAKEEAKPEEKKLSKKQLKKLKANDGKAVDATADTPDKKSVKFAEKLEQGPTPSSAEKKKVEKNAEKKPEKKVEKPAAAAEKPKSQVVQGVVIEDKKVGTGAVAKNGAKLGMRYIGKLQNGKTFDSNTKGKPFSFRLGRGEVIKGWDVGLAGMRIGGERRLTIPANMAYGKQSMAGIPANSTLIFDVKLLEVK